MKSSGKILIVDDDPTFIETYRDLLSQAGYEVEAASSSTEARQRAGSGQFAVVILDQKLEGSHGPDSGLDLLTEMQLLAPRAKIIVATAYVSKIALERAFRAGAYDYLEKDPRVFDVLLSIKVRNALEVHREREFVRLEADPAQSSLRLAELRQELRSETQHQRKGRLLEDLVALLFRGIAGFEPLPPRRSNGVQEIDIVIRNESSDPFWHREGSIILVECKNWTAPVPQKELLIFEGKMKRYRGRCRLGFFVAPSGFTSAFRVQQTNTATEPQLIVPIDGVALDTLITAQDRNKVLKDLVQGAAEAMGGPDK